MGKMMKMALNKPIRDEKGQALILVIILLLVGSLIIAPLLGFMSTGLIAGQVLEERMDELYAADAGVEDGLWQIVNEAAQLPLSTDDDPWIYSIADVNDKGVGVEIAAVWTIEDFFKGLYDPNIKVNPPSGHSDWAVIGGIPIAGTFTISITYLGSGNVSIKGVGAWLKRADTTYTYVAESVSGLTDDDEYPNYTFNDGQTHEGGTAFIWEWGKQSDRPQFSYGDTGTLTFNYLPEESPTTSFGWVDPTRQDIGIVTSGGIIEVWEITARATNPTTVKKTVVTAYVSREGQGTELEPYTMNILTWDIRLE